MNEIYKQSLSISNFAKYAMVHLFSKAELLECKNVTGRDPSKRVVGRSLDEARVETIRQMVQENAGGLFDKKNVENLSQPDEHRNFSSQKVQTRQQPSQALMNPCASVSSIILFIPRPLKVVMQSSL